MPNKWIDALKKWNTEKGGSWCIPRKGSPEMTAVKRIMEGKETTKEKSAREDRNKATMSKALQQLRGIEEETKIRNQARKASASAPATKKVKPDTLAKYLKGYSGAYQDYEDSRNAEVMYPTRVIKDIIRLAYNNSTLNEIVREVGYNKEETAVMIYDNFLNRTDIDNQKPYKDEESVMKIVDKF